MPAAAESPGPLPMQAAFERLRGEIEHSAFGRPMVLASSDSEGHLQGDVHAVIAHPLALIARSLKGVDAWCDVLMLHLNVKRCEAQPATGALSLAIGRKYDQPPAEAQWLHFEMHTGAAAADYFQVRFDAASGPWDTRNYRLLFEAIPLDGHSSFVHLSYAFDYGVTARLAMGVYLATMARDKVGFTRVDAGADAKPIYIGDFRGVIERNAIRYYFAIDAFLDAAGLPPEQRVERRLRAWFDATESYPRQLHELGREDYLTMKRRELTQ
ncbi:MAG: hypothetical protein KGN16_17715 [Burkholderiales bacterium]|nr:hypothetical protein [Burkholderiales bacterium]